MSRFKSINALLGVLMVLGLTLGTMGTASAHVRELKFKGQHLTIWDFFPSTPVNTPERVATNKVAQAWAKANGAKVTEPAQPANGSNTAFQANPKKAADIVMVPDDQAGADVGAHLVVQTHLDTSLYAKAAVSGCTLDGKTWCYPWALEEVGLYYNKHDVPHSLFSGKYTWTSVAKWAKKYASANPGKYGIAWAWENGYYDNDFLTAFGGGSILHTSKGYSGKKVILGSSATVKGLNALKTFINESGTGVNTYLTNEGYGSDFATGKDAIVLDGPWSDAQWVSAGLKRNSDYGFVPLPGFQTSGGVKYGTPFLGVQTLVVNKYSKHVAAAQSLAAYLSTHMELPLYHASGRIPATKAALKKVSGDEELKEYAKAFQHAEPLPNVPQMAAVWTPQQNAITLTLKGSGSASKNLKAAQAQICKNIGGCK
jgi:arabinogalactan oligomer/maltooligosaccharide transport system substrate-binding protein